MKARIFLVTLMMALSPTVAFAGGEASWSYEETTGPDHWGELARNWGICAKGRYQSPIDLREDIEIEATLGKLKTKINPTELRFGFDGPTFSVPYQSGSWLDINGTKYELQQFHFHHPSEHTVNGKHFPMEAHMVLKSKGSSHNDAVMGVFIEAGKANAMLDQFWGKLPRSGKKSLKGVSVNVGNLLPNEMEYYMYEGSMTTPSCPQGVRWFVLEDAVQASQAQIDQFKEDLVQGETNNRPIQPTFGRVVLKGE